MQTNNFNKSSVSSKGYAFEGEQHSFMGRTYSFFLNKMGLKNEEYINPKSILLEELKRLSKEYGLGDTYFTTEYDETGYPEKLFVIKVPEYKSIEDANDAHFKITAEIESFSKIDSQVFEFFRDSYIVLDY